MADMLTPAVLSKLPLGLLGFFGIKNGGQYPQSLGNVVLPQLDVLPLLQANYHENLAGGAGAGGITAIGFKQMLDPATTVAVIVPAAEIWYVNNITGTLFTGVGDSFTGSLVVRSRQNGSASNWHRSVSEQFTQAANLFSLFQGQREVWLSPGDELGVWTTAFVNASGNLGVGWQFEVTRFVF